MKDLTEYIEMQNPIIKKTIVTFHIRLDKESILSTLASESIFISGNYYKIPESQLLDCLINKRFGEIKLELEKI